MAIEMTNELRSKLIRAEAEEVDSILAEAGVKATQEEIDRLKFEIKRAAEHDGESLSLDEMDAVAGGTLGEYDYERDRCRATVEFGSDCWGEDGGCSFVHNSYTRPPVNVLCTCGRYMYKYGHGSKDGVIHGVLMCPYCKSTLAVDVRVYEGLEGKD